ncbi:MAG: penicillin-binding protein [Cyanobacteria bacterium M5B4]|nr:MAG: penicillin-binding protein [Cyanobacteria bacterium M5B4]
MLKDHIQEAELVAPDLRQLILSTVGKIALSCTMLLGSAIAGGIVGLALSFRDLPDVRVLKVYAPSETSYIYDINGELIARLHGDVNREVVPLERISPNLKRAVLAIEDSYFLQHNGIDPVGIARALVVNFQSKSTREGGSTLTQQLVKNLFLTNELSISRKAAEAFLSLRVEQVFDKNQILEMYLNQVYWGENTNGAETAAQNYFNKSAAELTLAESAMLAGIIQAPSVYNPFVDFKVAKQRQAVVLKRMLDIGWITEKEYKDAKNEPIKLGKGISFETSRVPYVSQAVAAELEERFGLDTVLKGGLRVKTTIDLKLQRMAERVAQESHDSLVYQGVGADQMAMVAVDSSNGFVKALVGGVGPFQKNQFNRAVQARRQLGSSFKPFVYYSAFATGNWAPDSVIDDSPVSFPDGDGYYSPQNYDNTFSGPISIRQAVAVSRNIPAVLLGEYVGIKKVIEDCRKMGINSPLPPVISLPLGAADITPMEAAGAYAMFANGGYKVRATLIAQVTDSKGNIILDNTNLKKEVALDPIAVGMVNDVLQAVVRQGTGTAAQLADGRPVAGKTGTTSDFRDAWFIGYVPQMSLAVWIGNDDYSPMSYGVTGGVFVAPIWRRFMERAMAGQPIKNFPDPSTIK